MKSKPNNRFPLAPRLFLARLRSFSLGIAVIQFFHLAIFAEAQTENFISWFAVNLLIQISLLMLRVSAKRSNYFANIPWQPLVTLLSLTFVFKVISRIPYILSWLAGGLYATRTNVDLGSSGMFSYFNIFFYPLAILLAFTVLPRRAYFISLGMVIVICLIDLVFLGTRNAPIFVLLFHLLIAPIRLKLNLKHVATMILIIVGFVSIFSYSTINRSWDSTEGVFDWINIFEFTGSAQVLKINRSVAVPLSEHVPAVLPAIFLSHYLSHSVAELANLVKLRDELDLGGMYYLTDQLGVIGVGSRDDSLWAIESANPRAGVYQTIFASLFFDFGIYGAILIWILSLCVICLQQLIKPNQLSIGVSFTSVIIALGPIENYLYNGLGLVQILSLFLVLFAFNLYGKLKKLMREPMISNKKGPINRQEIHAHPFY